MEAVLTGDIIASTKLRPEELNTVLDAMIVEFHNFQELYDCDFKIFRGDSFQGIISTAENALELALILKTALGKLDIKNEKISAPLDARIAIGIGAVELKRATILESNGEAFQLSGQALEAMDGEYPRLLLRTSDTEINDEFDVHFNFLDSISSKWSRESAEVIYYLLKNFKEREIAETLNISQPAINYRKKAANWESIAALIKRYRSVVKKYTDGK